MHRTRYLFLLLMSVNTSQANNAQELQQHIAQAFSETVHTIKQKYAYLDQKNINWSCIEDHYPKLIPTINSRADGVLFFEFFLHEFTDNHMTLNTNLDDSYRLYAPLFVKTSAAGFVVHDIWQDQLISTQGIEVGDQLISLNGVKTTQIIQEFPATCLDKNKASNQQWIINKALAGRYSQPRHAEFSNNGHKKVINLDQLTYKKNEGLLTTELVGDIGIIRFNNSLGQTALIDQFDQAIQQLNHSQGLIIDLRNTISGGDSYIARAIMGRFISADAAYQKHMFQEQYGGGPAITRMWVESVRPRPPVYNKPLLVLTNRWTGSMGEGLAIGLDGMGRGHLMGTQMARLLGAINGFQLTGLGYGFQMPVEQLFHVDGTPRESFKPDTYIQPSNTSKDFVLDQALKWFANGVQKISD